MSAAAAEENASALIEHPEPAADIAAAGQQRCRTCGKACCPKAKRCGGCGETYCSKRCQASDWSRHRVHCQRFQAQQIAVRRNFPLVSDEEWHPRHKASKKGVECAICLEAGDRIQPRLYTIRAGCACDRNPKTQYHAACLAESAVASICMAPGNMVNAFSRCSVCKMEFGRPVRSVLAQLAKNEIGKQIPATVEHAWTALQLSATAVDSKADPLRAIKTMRVCYEWAQEHWPDSKISIHSLIEWAATVSVAADTITKDMLSGILTRLKFAAKIDWVQEDLPLLADLARATMTLLHRIGKYENALTVAEAAVELYESTKQPEGVATTRIFQAQVLAAVHEYDQAAAAGEKGLAYFQKTYGDTHAVNRELPNMLHEFRAAGDHKARVFAALQSLGK